MIRLTKQTRLSPQETIKRAVAFFGPGGYGLKVHEEGPTGVRFEGGGGMVEVTCETASGKTSVEVTSREWDAQAKEFMTKVK